ncbi:hypothetical protein BHE74_00019202 [Ensete ventricosum]|nr:hypothetical protein GW17_00040556 [Ensete ventricosum]RWW72951.1 hypothetical protein BHE74_00019202 [Ensete ventricosum]RZS05197.1 hypothetical protein BHM03_00035674 [Ensete ventricosum]
MMAFAILSISTSDGRVYKSDASRGICVPRIYLVEASPSSQIRVSCVTLHNSLIDFGFYLGVSVSATGSAGPLPLVAQELGLSTSCRDSSGASPSGLEIVAYQDHAHHLCKINHEL